MSDTIGLGILIAILIAMVVGFLIIMLKQGGW